MMSEPVKAGTVGPDVTPMTPTAPAWDEGATPAWWDIDSRRYGVQIGGVRLLLPAGVESEVLESSQLTHLPRAPAELLGVVNVRGNLVPVFNLALLEHWPAANTEPGALVPVTVMIGKGSSVFALHVHGLPQPQRDLIRDTACELPVVLAPHLIAAWKTADDILWIELALEAMLGTRAASLSETSDFSFHSPSPLPHEEYQ